MGFFLDPDGDNCFTELANGRNSVFVDQTAFIASILNRLDAGEAKLVAFIRPRRFGKTVTAKMLSTFFSCGRDARALFQRLNIYHLESRIRLLLPAPP